VASIRVRSSLGKALVRIHRDRREIQYAVLTSIHSLVKECPSAFTPFLHDFYVKAMDPSFTRLLKLEILTLLALEPASIESVLKELRTYIRHDDDKVFCCAAIRAVGKVAELARIVHDRHAQNKSGNMARERKEANRVALNALYGLLTLTRASTDILIVGECSIVMERILLQLLSNGDGAMAVEDPNRIQEQTIKKLLLLLINSLSTRSLDDEEGDKGDDDDEEQNGRNNLGAPIPPLATAATLWMMGEWLAPTSTFSLTIPNFDTQTRTKTRLELVRLIARTYPVLEPAEKLQSIHFASKLLVSSASPKEAAVCEHVLSLGRAEVQHDVRDRARMESNMLHTSRGLQYDSDNLAIAVAGKTLAIEQVKKVLLTSKPPSSSLPLLDEQEKDGDLFRFGTLSSLVNRKAKAAYLPLPKWASNNSPSSLRDTNKAEKKSTEAKSDSWKVGTAKKNSSGFYDSDDSTDEGTFVGLEIVVFSLPLCSPIPSRR
jgi:AP-3 complex subunit beta